MNLCGWFGHRFRVVLVSKGWLEVQTNIKADDFRIEQLANGVGAEVARNACTRCGHVESERTRPSEPRQAVAERLAIPAHQGDPVRGFTGQSGGSFDDPTVVFDAELPPTPVEWPTEDVGTKRRIGCEWWQLDMIEVTKWLDDTREFVPGRQACTGYLVQTWPSQQYVCSNADNHWSR